MTSDEFYEVCEKNGDCQQPAVIYYKRLTWRGQRPVIDGMRLCADHAADVMPFVERQPLRHQAVRLDQQEFPF